MQVNLAATVSNKPRLTAEEKEDYFEHFLQGKAVDTIDSRTFEIERNNAIDSGLCTFEFADGSVMKARYTFTFIWNGKQRLISSHHLPAMPKKNSSASPRTLRPLLNSRAIGMAVIGGFAVGLLVAGLRRRV